MTHDPKTTAPNSAADRHAVETSRREAEMRPKIAALVARGMWQVALEFGEFTEEEAICASGDDWHQYLPDAEKLITKVQDEEALADE